MGCIALKRVSASCLADSIHVLYGGCTWRTSHHLLISLISRYAQGFRLDFRFEPNEFIKNEVRNVLVFFWGGGGRSAAKGTTPAGR
jgi:hypothetical protein